MDNLNHDVTNVIFKQLPASDRLRLHTVFNEPRPTQFQVSSELIASNGFRGNKGLMMRVITPSHRHDDDDEYLYSSQLVIDMMKEQFKVGNYEPCVQAMVLIQKQLNIDPWTTRASDVRKDVKNFRRQLQLIDIGLNSIPTPINWTGLSNWNVLCIITAEICENMLAMNQLRRKRQLHRRRRRSTARDVH